MYEKPVWFIPVARQQMVPICCRADTLEEAMEAARHIDGRNFQPFDVRWKSDSWELAANDVGYVRAQYNRNRADRKKGE